MTTFAIAAEVLLDEPADAEDALPRSVANPRRTTWTGFAKDHEDRLPAN